jgi:hypothetical protein
MLNVCCVKDWAGRSATTGIMNKAGNARKRPGAIN